MQEEQQRRPRLAHDPPGPLPAQPLLRASSPPLCSTPYSPRIPPRAQICHRPLHTVPRRRPPRRARRRGRRRPGRGVNPYWRWRGAGARRLMRRGSSDDVACSRQPPQRDLRARQPRPPGGGQRRPGAPPAPTAPAPAGARAPRPPAARHRACAPPRPPPRLPPAASAGGGAQPRDRQQRLRALRSSPRRARRDEDATGLERRPSV